MRKQKHHQSSSHAPAAEEQPVALNDEAPAPPPEEAPPPRRSAKQQPRRWRVVKEALANVNGSFTRLVEGQVLDPLGYSDTVLESIRAQGVVLEPVE